MKLHLCFHCWFDNYFLHSFHEMINGAIVKPETLFPWLNLLRVQRQNSKTKRVCSLHSFPRNFEVKPLASILIFKNKATAIFNSKIKYSFFMSSNDLHYGTKKLLTAQFALFMRFCAKRMICAKA